MCVLVCNCCFFVLFLFLFFVGGSRYHVNIKKFGRVRFEHGFELKIGVYPRTET